MPEDHYIAQTYLKSFGDPTQGGMLHGYKKPSGDSFPCWPQDVCREWNGDINHFLNDSKLLGAFRKIFEPSWNFCVTNIVAGNISNDIKLAMSGYIANLQTCTPAWIMGYKKTRRAANNGLNPVWQKGTRKTKSH